MPFSVSMRETSQRNHSRVSLHCTGGKKSQRKRGFSYFLCCGCGNDDDVIEKEPKPNAPYERPKDLVSPHPISSHSSDRSPYAG